MSLSAITDAANAAERLCDVFEAETLDETQIHDPDLKSAIEIDGAEFTWDTPPSQVDDPKKKKSLRSKNISTITTVNPTEDVPFKVKETNLSIPRGQLIAVVGPVGTGKTSLLQGIIGDMRRTAGTVKLSGSVSYCPQSAWIQVGLSSIDQPLSRNNQMGWPECYDSRKYLLRTPVRGGQVLEDYPGCLS